jgi:hypothetical protein
MTVKDYKSLIEWEKYQEAQTRTRAAQDLFNRLMDKETEAYNQFLQAVEEEVFQDED